MPKMITKNETKRIAFYRDEKGWSFKYIGIKMGLDMETVSKKYREHKKHERSLMRAMKLSGDWRGLSKKIRERKKTLLSLDDQIKNNEKIKGNLDFDISSLYYKKLVEEEDLKKAKSVLMGVCREILDKKFENKNLDDANKNLDYAKKLLIDEINFYENIFTSMNAFRKLILEGGDASIEEIKALIAFLFNILSEKSMRKVNAMLYEISKINMR